jgi:nucleotidyltransferase/DNA polymerase involved in DNA repair
MPRSFESAPRERERRLRVAIACVSVPHFALRVALLDRPELDGMPLVLAAAPGGRPLVDDATPEAAAYGIRTGMALKEASALCPEVVIVQPNPLRDAEVFERIVARLEQLSPLVEPEESGVCSVDLRGLDRHYGAPAQAAGRLLQTIQPILRPRAGIGPGKFVAWVAARQAEPGTVLAVEPESLRDFLAEQPVAYLPLPVQTVRRLEQLGIRRFAELTALSRSAVQARFGPQGGRAWDLARGQDERPVVPRPREERVVEQLILPAPAVSRETLIVAIHQLVARAFGRPALRGRSVRQARLRAAIEDNRSWEHTAVLREPVDGPRLARALEHRLQAVELPGPLEALTLELSGLTAEAAYQEPLLNARPRRARQVVEAVRQLKQRYGASPIYRVVEVEPWSRIPERRRALITYDP